MSRRISLIHHDYCPYLEERHGVRVDYAEFSMLGAAAPGYKILGYSCDCSDDCPYPRRDVRGLVLYSTLRRKNHSDLHH